MIPLKDENPSGCIPFLTYALIAVNVAAFMWELSLPHGELQAVIQDKYGMVPAHATEVLQGDRHVLKGLVMPVFTSMFLHGGLMHLLGNMLFLGIFGDNLEARFGRVRFLIFYICCGLAASATHYLLAPQSSTPTIGASGAIAGVLGAYIVTWPRARVITLIPIFYFIRIVSLPAFVVLGLWFLLQIFPAMQNLQAEGEAGGGGVAYWAHVGGFVAGLAYMVVVNFARKQKKRRKKRKRKVNLETVNNRE